MGPENSEAENLLLYTESGERIVPIRNLPKVTVTASGEVASAMFRVMEKLDGTINIKPGKHWRCKSRKRFIKLLMSKGISRNLAGSVARVARIAGVPYRELWQSYFFWG